MTEQHTLTKFHLEKAFVPLVIVLLDTKETFLILNYIDLRSVRKQRNSTDTRSQKPP